MERDCISAPLSERLARRLCALLRAYRAPLLGALICGLAAYMVVLTDKLPNHDDLEFLFGIDLTLENGRWGLWLLTKLLPGHSMPWLWGGVAILLSGVSSCLIVRTFSIRSKLLQFLLAAAIVTFPSEIGNMSYMVTTHINAIAFLCTVAAVRLCVCERRRWLCRGLALLLLTLMLGIYQAYLSLAASLFVILLVKFILNNEKTPLEALHAGIGYVLLLALALAAYFALALIVQRITGTGLGEYAQSRVMRPGWMLRALPENVAEAYARFMRTLFRGEDGLVQTRLGVILHVLCIGATVAAVLGSLKRVQGALNRVLLLALLALMPLAINCVLLFVQYGLHTLTQYSFAMLYVLAAVALDPLPRARLANAGRDVVALSLAAIAVINICVANQAYLQMKLYYENNYHLYSSIMARIEALPEFDADSEIALVGATPGNTYDENFQFAEIMGIGGLRNAYRRERFFSYYLGMDVKFASEEKAEELARDPRVREMPAYPYAGYAREIDGCIVVKLSETASD